MKVVLLLLVGWTSLVGGIEAQIDPLVYSEGTEDTRVSLRLGHTFDSLYLAGDDSAWREDEVAFHVSIERSVTQAASASLSVSGSLYSFRPAGASFAPTWDLDHLVLTLHHPFASPFLGAQGSVSGGIVLPLDRSHAAYQARAAFVWLTDPLALELETGLTTMARRRLALDLSTGFVFVANRRFGLATRFTVEDVLDLPVSAISVALVRQPAIPGGPMWGVGAGYSVEAGRMVPGVHWLMSVGLGAF